MLERHLEPIGPLLLRSASSDLPQQKEKKKKKRRQLNTTMMMRRGEDSRQKIKHRTARAGGRTAGGVTFPFPQTGVAGERVVLVRHGRSREAGYDDPRAAAMSTSMSMSTCVCTQSKQIQQNLVRQSLIKFSSGVNKLQTSTRQ